MKQALKGILVGFFIFLIAVICLTLVDETRTVHEKAIGCVDGADNQINVEGLTCTKEYYTLGDSEVFYGIASGASVGFGLIGIMIMVFSAMILLLEDDE